MSKLLVGLNPQEMELVSVTTPDGEVFDFQDFHNRFVFDPKPSGGGFPPINFLQFVPYKANFSRYLGFRLQNRTIALTYRSTTDNREDFWTARAALLDHLRPNRTLSVDEAGQATLSFQRADGEVYNIRVLTGDPVFENQDTWDEFGFTETIGFLCLNPVWFQPATQTFLAAYSLASELIFPIQFDANNIFFGEEGQIFEGDLTYTGTWRTYPVVTAIGPFDFLQLEQVDTGAVLLVNAPVSNNEQLIIDIENQTVGRYQPVASGGAFIDDYLPFVSPTSDFINWYIAPDAVAPDGANTIKIIAPSALAGTTQVTFDYLNRYIGI